jgi:hypothetical protein
MITTFPTHTIIAGNIGAQIIQFEPYWYFFDDYDNPQEIIDAIWATI